MYYITTPIPYTNSRPHLGHLLEALFTDTIARFKQRSQTDRVFLQMGVDQHGLKIYEAAQKEGKTPEVFVEEQAQNFIDLWKQFEVRYDGFVKTSSKHHASVAQLVWKKLVKKECIVKKSYTGLYCTGCEDFYAPSQLVGGNCPVHGTKPVEMNEENYFFTLSQFQETVAHYLKTADIRPNYIAKEYLNFIEDLQDISISREKSRLPWGVGVPGDSEQVMYVWFEALINYLTAVVDIETLEEASEFHYMEENIDALWDEIVKAMPIDLMYISKEIAKFHVVVFVAMLRALDLPLPQQVLAHGLINDANGKKFSKSLGNGVYPEELVEKFGVDGTRFIMLHDINIDGDTSFDWKTITESYNSHLANTIGNLLMRVTTLVATHFDGDIDIYQVYEKPYRFESVYIALENLDPKTALDEVLAGARWGNEYLEETKPWTLIKQEETEKAREVLTKLCVLLWDLSEVLSIFMPETAEIIHRIITAETIEKAPVLFQKVEIAE
jgi:methionyl-tRNA synthetase